MASTLPMSNTLGIPQFLHKYQSQVNLSKYYVARQQSLKTKKITCINSDQKAEPHLHRQSQNGRAIPQEIKVIVFFLKKKTYYLKCLKSAPKALFSIFQLEI
jgi:hypothetical protein